MPVPEAVVNADAGRELMYPEHPLKTLAVIIGLTLAGVAIAAAVMK